MLIRRVLSAMVLVPLVAGLVYVGEPWYFGAVAIAALLASHEFYRMVERGGRRPARLLGIALTALLLLDARYSTWQLVRPSLAVVLLFSLVEQLFREGPRRSLVDWALTLAGGLYIGWLAGYFILLRDLSRGMEWTVLMFLSTWANDTVAYCVGIGVGRRPFASQISPHKTWEGSIGGWVSGVAVTALMGGFLGLPLEQVLVLGLVIALAATLGDLAVSFIKRQVGVKDTSDLIPGHGGMLDRMDSLLFSVVVVYYYAIWVAGR